MAENVQDFLMQYIADDQDEDEEEDLWGVRNPGPRRRRRLHLLRIDYFHLYSNAEFRRRFRLTKLATLALLRIIEPNLQHLTNRFWQVSPMTQLLVALRFYATGSIMILIGDFMGLCKSTVWRIIHRVSHAIALLRPIFIKFPSTPEEIREAQAKFYGKSAMPNVIGSIDCKHVRILPFRVANAESYRNRKGFFSFNVQAVCNADLEIIDIVARWPGSSHDSTIFRHSRTHAEFEAGMYGDAVLVGDSGYPSRPYLLTPLQEPRTPGEVLYNESQIRTRNVIERCFGVWARRFMVLSGSRFRSPNRTIPMIVATAVLHNICCLMKPNFQGPVNVAAYARRHRNLQMNGDTRRQLINEHFEHLV